MEEQIPVTCISPDDEFGHNYGLGVEHPDGGLRYECSICGDVQTISSSLRTRVHDSMVRVFSEHAAKEKEQVRTLGVKIGYGNIMYRASECWEEELSGAGLAHGGGAFVVGPCKSQTVRCDHETGYSRCEWCCGCGWITKHVKALKDASSGRQTA